ncbi:hypothetical protein Cylst_6497 (plasmid) [Cylindrospermum stagnale PCC 7417]|uniref:Uncharacterized protein n=1 Tax=Cylindrospermum stagnale PCC 7417 TaxID=56107 RepID=K9X712_9NOST|nr:hypothetical protein [Cylindrospermum stagnale]AFZ28278.1 hypothetical protein Cylst_6497 [Cylindrospermum stagnale PCC 7417]
MTDSVFDPINFGDIDFDDIESGIESINDVPLDEWVGQHQEQLDVYFDTLTNAGVPEDLASESAKILINDNPNLPSLGRSEQDQATISSSWQFLQNEVDSVGFPEGQILPHCNGDADLCGELSAIYHQGGEFPTTGNEALDRVCGYLGETSGYGLFAEYLGEE